MNIDILNIVYIIIAANSYIFFYILLFKFQKEIDIRYIEY